MSVASINETIVDQFSKNGSWKIVEDYNPDNLDSVVDGNHVLARVQGPFFLVEGTSLNNRFYSRKLWENAIAKADEKLKNGGLFGAIGHEQPLDEKAVMEGKISHTVTKLWIDENNRGMGEILVLGTNSGKQLNTLLRAGMQLPVSSRAYGKISGRGPNDEDIVEADSFHLETFDFVLSPGVSSAYPKVIENLPKNEDLTMNVEQLQKLTEEKVDLQSKLTESLSTQLELRESLSAKDQEIASLKEELVRQDEGLRKWLELPILKDYADKAGLTRQYGKTSKDFSDKLLHMTEELLSELSRVGTLESIKESIERLNAHNEQGTVEEITRTLDLLEKYVGIGTPERIQKKLAMVDKVKAVVLEAKQKAAARKIAKHLESDFAATFEMVKRMGVKATIMSLRKLRESAGVKSRYRVNGGTKSVTKKNESNINKHVRGGFANRLFESLPEPVATKE